MKADEPARPRVILLHPEDNVVVALEDLAEGETISSEEALLVLRDAIPLGFKIARHQIARGAPVRKYGAPIGSATRDIAAGALVHAHNLQSDYLPPSDP